MPTAQISDKSTGSKKNKKRFAKKVSFPIRTHIPVGRAQQMVRKRRSAERLAALDRITNVEERTIDEAIETFLIFFLDEDSEFLHLQFFKTIFDENSEAFLDERVMALLVESCRLLINLHVLDAFERHL